MKKIIDVSEIENLAYQNDGYDRESYVVDLKDLRALLDKAPTLQDAMLSIIVESANEKGFGNVEISDIKAPSGEAVAWCIDDGFTKKILDRTPSDEDIAHAKMFNWLVYPLYTTPQPDRVAELEATNKKLLDALDKAKAKIKSASCCHENAVPFLIGEALEITEQAIAEAEGK